jgi:hypothetical protein
MDPSIVVRLSFSLHSNYIPIILGETPNFSWEFFFIIPELIMDMGSNGIVDHGIAN